MARTIAQQTKLHDYEAFVDKFKPKKTTDDCYTPKAVYDSVLNHVHENVMNLDGYEIARPFYPGGDYETFPYNDSTVVIDNPPFSILGNILDFYILNDIKFFLFAPHLTLFNYLCRSSICCVVCGLQITYENGAKVNTSFLTNMLPEYCVVVDGDLYRAMKRAQEKVNKVAMPKKIIYPDNLCTATRLSTYISTRGGNLKIRKESGRHVWNLDNGYKIFGSGLFISDSVVAEKAVIEKAVAEKTTTERRLTLSSDELDIIRNLK